MKFDLKGILIGIKDIAMWICQHWQIALGLFIGLLFVLYVVKQLIFGIFTTNNK